MSLLCSAGLVVLARGLNPIPFRTRPLNPSAPMVLRLKTRESRSPPGLQSTAKDTLHEVKPSRHQRHPSRNGGQGDRHETPAQPGANPPDLIHTPKAGDPPQSPTVPSPRMKPPGPKPRQDHPESGNAQANDARERPRGGRAERKARAKETPDCGEAARSRQRRRSGKAMPATEAAKSAKFALHSSGCSSERRRSSGAAGRAGCGSGASARPPRLVRIDRVRRSRAKVWPASPCHPALGGLLATTSGRILLPVF